MENIYEYLNSILILLSSKDGFYLLAGCIVLLFLLLSYKLYQYHQRNIRLLAEKLEEMETEKVSIKPPGEEDEDFELLFLEPEFITFEKEPPLVPPAKKEVPPEKIPREKPAPPEKVKPIPEKIPPKTLAEGLKKTQKGFIGRLNSLFSRKKIDDDLLDELEEILFTADIGIRTADILMDDLRENLGRKELQDFSVMQDCLKENIRNLLTVENRPFELNKTPYVIMMVGVNGVGKTTSIGKIASKFNKQGHKVALVAGDTFRAAAVEQLEIWGERVGCKVFKGKNQADPGSVIYDAINSAKSKGIELLLVDTAGRLHTKVNLMEELKKIKRVMNKALPGAPHETMLVLDANTGQNAISQAQMFHESLQVDSIVSTKLDGTAKGGVVIGICNELKIPIKYIGIGERVEDLRTFDHNEFVDALFS